MSKKKESKKGFSTLNRILILQLVLMLALSGFITKRISDSTQQNAIDHMTAITDERAHIIQNYVEQAENTLKNFSKASQVIEALENLNDEGKVKAAQDYTTEFGKDIDALEGLWIGTWETEVVTHTNPGVVGMRTREGEKLEQLRNALLERGDEVFDTGITISPASGAQVVSMYKAVYDNNHKPVGFVSLGLYTEGLLNTLDTIPISGVENSFYSMVNVNDGTYVFYQPDSEQVGREVKNNDELKKLSESLKGNYTDARKDNFEYKLDGKKYISIYSYIPTYGWILTIDDTKGEVFNLTTTMVTYLGVFAALIVMMTIVFYFISKRQEKVNQTLVSAIAKNSQTRKSLNEAMFTDVLTNVNNRISFSMDLEKADSIKPYYFLLFNIKDFSGINTMFGNDAGDGLLIRTVDVLKENFPGQSIYRTGSDEFVVMIPTENGAPLAEAVLDSVNTAFRQLLVPEKTENLGTIYPKYKVAVVKKSGSIDTSIVTVLKDMTNRTGEATYGLIDYIDLTNQ